MSGQSTGTTQHAEKRGLAESALRPWNVLAIAVSAISPTTSVFLVYGTGLETAGAGVVWAFLIGAAIALAMSLCYAEVGSVFPSAGGAYTIVQRALGSVWGGMVAVLFLVLGLTSTASILTSAATYLSAIIPGGLPVGWVALGMMVLVTALSVGKISPASWVAAAMLILELGVILVFIVLAFVHMRPDSDPFGTPAGGSGGMGMAAILAAVVPALFAFNGYDWPLYFAEESRGSARSLPKAVVTAAIIAVVIEVLAAIAASFAISDPGAVANEESPLAVIATQVMGPLGATILLAGVVIAMFDTGLAANLGYARIYYTAARDGVFPGAVGRFLAHVSAKTKVPTHAFAFLFVGNGLLCVFSSLTALITFTSVVIGTIYLLVAISALVCRIRDRERPRAFRLPFWPLPPLLAIAGVILAFTQQSVTDLVIALGLALLALGIYFLVRRRLPDRLEG